VVHHAVAALTLFGLACCIVVLGSCGGSSSASHEASDAAPPAVGTVQKANCTDWKKGSVDERVNMVVALRTFAGGQVGSSAGIQTGPVLDDGRAYRIFQSYCRNYFARGFKLYKLYERAAAYVGSAPAPGPRPHVPLPR
jgi:hypothetical protein